MPYKIKSFFPQMWHYARRHKIKSSIALILVLIAGYYGYRAINKTEEETRYILASVVKGMINTSVSGTGQVSVLEQIEIKPEVSGELVYLNIQKDREIKAGTLLAQLNARDAQKAVWNADIDLANAQLSSKDIKSEAEDELDAAFENGLNVLTNTFKDLTSIAPELEEMFLESSYRGNQGDIDYYLGLVRSYNSNPSELYYWTSGAEEKYLNIQSKIDAIEERAWMLSKSSNPEQIENAINETYNTTKTILDLIRQTFNLVQKYQKILDSKNLTAPIPKSTSAEQASQLSESVSSLISRVENLSAAKSSITDKKESVLKVGVNLKTQNLTIKQYEYALSDAKENLAKHYIYAPLDGVIAQVNSNIKKGDSVSSASSLATLITEQKIAEIALSEVDVVNIKAGNKATLTFDAAENLTITGRVIEVDSIGTASSGVISYGVKIAFDTDEEKIKPGMSVSATIITNSKNDVLAVPSTAVKSQGDTYYVQVLSETYDLTDKTNSIKGVTSKTAPTTKTVEIGLSDDTNTEITNGLSEGDQIVVRTSSSTTSSTISSSSSNRNNTGNILNIGGGGLPPGISR